MVTIRSVVGAALSLGVLFLVVAALALLHASDTSPVHYRHIVSNYMFTGAWETPKEQVARTVERLAQAYSDHHATTGNGLTSGAQPDVFVFRKTTMGSVTLFAADTDILAWVNENEGEKSVTHVFEQVLGPPSRCRDGAGVVLDVGANSAMYSLMAAKHGCRVFTFEPQPSCYSHILGAVGVNSVGSRVAIQPFAVSNISGYDVLFGPDTPCNGQHQVVTSAAAEPLASPPPMSSMTAIKTITLDDFASNEGLDTIDLIKIDTEGFEYQALQGGLGIFTSGKVRNVIVEITPIWWYQQSRSDVANLFTHIMVAGNFSAEVLRGTFGDADAPGLKTVEQMVEYILSRSGQVDVWLHRAS